MQMVNRLKKGARIFIALSLILSLSAAVLFASATTSWVAPTRPMAVDPDVITISVRGAAETLPLFLGANMVTARVDQNRFPTDGSAQELLARTAQSTFLGIAGTGVNANPDPYLWNFFYNAYANANGLPITEDAIHPNQQGAPTMADTTILPEYGTAGSLVRRPDIILGISPGSTGLSYLDLIADLPENQDNDPNNDYNPSLIAYVPDNIGTMIQTMHTVAEEMNKISAATGKTARYGDQAQIAIDYENFIRGVQYYVLSEIEKNNIPKKTIALIDPADLGDGTFNAYTSQLSSGTAAFTRGGEYSELTTINIVDKLGLREENGTYKITAQQLLDADVIFIAGAQGASMAKDDFITVLVDKYNIDAQGIRSIPIFDAFPATVFGVVMNSVENAIGFPLFQSFIYAEDISINPVYAVAYYYEKFYHLTNAEAIANVIAANFQNASLPRGITTSLSQYRAADFEAKLLQGRAFYQANEARFRNTLAAWDISRTAAGQTSGDGEITVLLNGRSLAFDEPPQIVNGRALVPLRVIFEALGASVEWDPATSTVKANKDGIAVVLVIGDTKPTVNGQVVEIDQPGIISNERSLVPLRFVGEVFGADVNWSAATRTITITN